MEKKFTLLFFLILIGLQGKSQSDNIPKLGRDPVKKVIDAMTLEEKAYFVTGAGMFIPGTSQLSENISTPGAPTVGHTQKLIPGAAGTTYEIPRLGIPAMVFADGPAGLRINPVRENDSATYYCTAFPVATLLASSWDTGLIYRVGQAMGSEVLEYGVDILLGPGMNIHRNPLCGRNFEYYSEDPVLTGKMAATMINGIESNGVGTSAKHYAANNTETNRNALNTIVSERALREIYLRGFSIAVQEAQPWTIMSSYNLINGVYAPESHDLITKILRDDWGFKGFVMTDWFGGKDPVAMMIAGNDLLMPGRSEQALAIIKAVKEGKLDLKILDRNIERILNIILNSPRFKGYQYSNKPDLKANAAIARMAAAEGMVLLKNDNHVLPLTEKTKSIAVFGNTSYEIITGGTGSGDVNEAYSVSLVDGLKGAGYVVHENLMNTYLSYIKTEKEKRPKRIAFMPEPPIPEMNVNMDLTNKMAKEADIALITIGRNSGEFYDRTVEGDFTLSIMEKNMLRNISDAFHAQGKKIVVILNIGGVIETSSWRDIPDAILLAWQGGQEAGNAIADVISGKVNPSGKLATTFPIRYEDVSSAKNFPGQIIETGENKDNEPGIPAFMRPKPSRIVYEEGIYVGYRYFNTFKIPVAYEFGYGLSYTKFEYGKLKMSSKDFNDKIMVSVSIKNTGNAAGREVVQLYLSAPANKLDKPSEELKGFKKTKLLQPGEEQIIDFEISKMDLASFDSKSSSWIAEAGIYNVKIGASSRDIKQTDTFRLKNDILVKKESIALVPSEKINELKP